MIVLQSCLDVPINVSKSSGSLVFTFIAFSGILLTGICLIGLKVARNVAESRIRFNASSCFGLIVNSCDEETAY